MSHQLTFADSEFSSKRRQTRKEIFLSRMEQILPWQNMVEVIEPFYPKAGNGRRPYPLETMLRIHCMQHWYNLSDGAMEDALYEIASMRLFARLSLDSALPDRTTIMNSATCWSSINWPANCSRPSIAGWPKQAS
ncbi:IS5 transposase and trans-activator [Escherichia coli]|nr:IS5 transposase and trans-activator [Escherichia coli]